MPPGNIAAPRRSLPLAAAGAVMGLFALLVAMPKPQAHPAPADDYARCAVCHKHDGSGSPGIAPPLQANAAALAATPAGRRYLALTLIKGVSGPLTINGARYGGFMPAQAGMNDAAVASVLNTVLADKAGSKAKPFAAAEVGGYRAQGAALNAAAVGKSRP